MTHQTITSPNQLPRKWRYVLFTAPTLEIALAELRRNHPGFEPESVYQYGNQFFFPADWRRE